MLSTSIERGERSLSILLVLVSRTSGAIHLLAAKIEAPPKQCAAVLATRGAYVRKFMRGFQRQVGYLRTGNRNMMPAITACVGDHEGSVPTQFTSCCWKTSETVVRAVFLTTTTSRGQELWHTGGVDGDQALSRILRQLEKNTVREKRVLSKQSHISSCSSISISISSGCSTCAAL